MKCNRKRLCKRLVDWYGCHEGYTYMLLNMVYCPFCGRKIKSLMSELEKLQDENRRLISELEQSRAEVKRLKALLAHNGIPL